MENIERGCGKWLCGVCGTSYTGCGQLENANAKPWHMLDLLESCVRVPLVLLPGLQEGVGALPAVVAKNVVREL